MESVAKVSLLVFGVLMILGGVAGFAKAKSKASLIAGGVSGLISIALHFVAASSPQAGFISGIVLTSVLLFVFAMRLRKTRKFMPSGMLLILTAIEELILVMAAFVKI